MDNWIFVAMWSEMFWEQCSPDGSWTVQSCNKQCLRVYSGEQ